MSPAPIIGLDIACPEPGCMSIPELHGPSERGVAPLPEVHTVEEIEDVDGQFKVSGQRMGDHPWSLTVQTRYGLTPQQGHRLAHAVLVTSARIGILERARVARLAGD